jgi:tRNA(Ile)-lysidine synthase
MYHESVPSLLQRTLAYIHEHDLIRPGHRISAAVSGGADSVALLRILLELRGELGIVLSVVHFDHQLRGAESEQDRQFVAELATLRGLPFHQSAGDVKAHAKAHRKSLETAARDLRYAYFRDLLRTGTVEAIATGHTLDDQAETVLMRVARGAGTRGLAGIYPALRNLEAGYADDSDSADRRATIIRPLLAARREDLVAYLREIGQQWREDRSNLDLRHARNRVRHGILPRMQRHLNPALRDNLAELAEIARAEEGFWEHEVARCWPRVWDSDRRVLRIEVLRDLHVALQRRVVRQSAEQQGFRLDFRQVREILGVGLKDAGYAAELTGGWRVFRQGSELRLAKGMETVLGNYEYLLSIPGRTSVLETGSHFETVLVAPGDRESYAAEDLIDPKLVGSGLRVRNWRPGDRFWPAHRKQPKKVKELLQERRVTGNRRKAWPVVAGDTEIVWMRGFSVAAMLRAPESAEAIMIRETERD